MDVAGESQGAARFRLIAPTGEKFSGRKIVTARIIADGVDWGEFCEMIVESDL